MPESHINSEEHEVEIVLRFKVEGPTPDAAYLKDLASSARRGVQDRIEEVGLTEDETRCVSLLAAAPLVLRPMEDAPLDTFVLLVGDSGYTSTPWRVEVCRKSADDDWRDHANDHFTDGGAPPIGWLPLPACLKSTEQ